MSDRLFYRCIKAAQALWQKRAGGAFATLSLMTVLLLSLLPSLAQDSITVTAVATGLRNPRGVAVLPDGRLIVAEAGDALKNRETSGRISVFDDRNADGDYDDADEREVVQCCTAGYNTLTHFGTGQDEVGGLGDLIVLPDGRIAYTQDDPLGAYVPDGATRGIAVYTLTPDEAWRRREVRVLRATTNGLVYDPDADLLYLAESGLNAVSSLTLAGELSRPIVEIPPLDSVQQAVPAGITRDPRTGDLLVALFSGQIRNYYGTVIAYMPEQARIVRLNPSTGELRDEITGLTTAVDVAIDEQGNIFVAELATGWPAAVMPRDFPLDDPDAPPDAGGYPRFSGRVTLYPADGGDPVRLAEGLDQPTNLSYHDGALYVSVGQGTTGRPIMGPDGLTRITGTLLKITGF
jgi:sugar lactone lactonase YvrE